MFPATSCRSRMITDASAFEDPRKTYTWERHLVRFGNSGLSRVQGVTQLHSEIRDQDPLRNVPSPLT